MDEVGHSSNAITGLTFFRSAARGLHMPATLTPESAKHEGLQPRASERPRVGCCEELAGPSHLPPWRIGTRSDYGSKPMRARELSRKETPARGRRHSARQSFRALGLI